MLHLKESLALLHSAKRYSTSRSISVLELRYRALWRYLWSSVAERGKGAGRYDSRLSISRFKEVRYASQKDVKPVFMVLSLVLAHKVTNKDGFSTLVGYGVSLSSLQPLYNTSVARRKDTVNKPT